MVQDWKIHCLVPDLPAPAAVLPYLEEMHARRWYSNFGPLALRFEEEMAASLRSVELAGKALHVVSLSSATAGLELILRISGLRPGARVLVPALTFPATILAVLNTGFTPVIADVDADRWELTPAIAEDALARQEFDAVMPVAAFGYSLDAAAWQAFSRKTGLPVFFDAAASLGQQSLSSDIPTVFSLHATKPFGVGEGGLLVTGDEALALRARRQINFGFDSGEIVEPGTNAKMAEYFAAVGLAQKERWQEVLDRRNYVFALYREMLDDLPVLFCKRERIVPATFPVDTGGRGARLVADLTDAGIQTRRWYLPPLHRHPSFSSVPRASEQLVESERLDASLVGLPLHGFLGRQDIETIAKIIKSSLSG